MMRMFSIMIVLFAFAFHVKGGDTLVKRRCFIEIAGGPGYFPGGGPVDPSGGAKKFSAIISGGFNFGINSKPKPGKFKKDIQHFFTGGLSCGYQWYKVDRAFYGSGYMGLANSYSNWYTPDKFSYEVNKLNIVFFVGRSRQYKNGIYIGSRIGLSFVQYLNKKEFEYTAHHHSAGVTGNGGVWTFYDNWSDEVIKERNYYDDHLNATYSLTIGCTKKHISYFFSNDVLFMSAKPCSGIIKLNLGIAVLL